MENEIIIGAFGASLILNVLLRMLYNTVNIGNIIKPWIAAGIGIALGIVAMYYNLKPDACITFKMTVDYILGGFMTGVTAVGMYEMTQKRNGK